MDNRVGGFTTAIVSPNQQKAGYDVCESCARTTGNRCPMHAHKQRARNLLKGRGLAHRKLRVSRCPHYEEDRRNVPAIQYVLDTEGELQPRKLDLNKRYGLKLPDWMHEEE